MTAVAYLRCSGFGEGTDTWDRQLECISKFCASHGYELGQIYREDAMPGKLDAEYRPQFRQMLTDLAENGCTTIVVERMDRLARRYGTQESLITHIFNAGLTLFSADTGENITEAMMGDPMRRALVQIQGIFSELDKNMLVFKLRKARERLRTANGKCEGRKAFGAKESEADTLGLISSLAGSGLQAHAIAQQLNTRGIPTRYQRRWHAGTVSKILSRRSA